ncbi:interleukin-5 receptor subunit alpha isoform 2-T2 [Discoglossus pictus]
MIMSGVMRFLLILFWIQVESSGHLQPPSDFKIWTKALGEFQLSWTPAAVLNSGEKQYDLKYIISIEIPGLNPEKYRTMVTNSERKRPLHRGVFAEVTTVLLQSDQIVSQSETVSANLPPSSGAEGTAVTQLYCNIQIEESLNVSLTCNWEPGDKAPRDTQYYMYYRFDQHTDTCNEYATEVGGQRHIACRVPSSHINMKSMYPVYVLINGTSGSLEIQSFDHWYKLEEIEILNPPRNLSVLEQKGRPVLHWMRTLSPLPDSCFLYQVKICNLRTGSITIKNVSNVFLEKGDLEEPWSYHSLQVRTMRREFCGKKLYSVWSEVLYTGTKRNPETAITLSVCLTLLGVVSALLCVRFHFWRKLFPKIPKPKLKDAFSSQKCGPCLAFWCVPAPSRPLPPCLVLYRTRTSFFLRHWTLRK